MPGKRGTPSLQTSQCSCENLIITSTNTKLQLHRRFSGKSKIFYNPWHFIYKKVKIEVVGQPVSKSVESMENTWKTLLGTHRNMPEFVLVLQKQVTGVGYGLPQSG